jgi:hypothetical protein
MMVTAHGCQMELAMVEPPDPKLLKAIRDLDTERTERIRYQRAAQALKLQVGQLRRQVQQLTTDRAAIQNRLSRESARRS